MRLEGIKKHAIMVRLNPNDRFAGHPAPIEGHRPPPPPSSPSWARRSAAAAMGGGGEGKKEDVVGRGSNDERDSHRTSSFEYEFGGPIGALLTMISLPLIILLLTHWASEGRIAWTGVTNLLHAPVVPGHDHSSTSSSSSSSSCASPIATSSSCSRQLSSSFSTRFLHFLCPACGDLDDDDGLMTEVLWCALVVLSWVVFQVMLERALPCELVEGAPLPCHQ